MNERNSIHRIASCSPELPARIRSNDGISLVSVMLALSLLGVFALVAASLAVNERRTSFNDLSHAQSFIAADSGGEAAIAWLMMSSRPPMITDMATGKVQNRSMTAMNSSAYQDFGFDVRMRPDPDPNRSFMMRPRPGYDPRRYMDFFYDVDASGEAGTDGRSDVSVIVTKLTQLNYN